MQKFQHQAFDVYQGYLLLGLGLDKAAMAEPTGIQKYQ